MDRRCCCALPQMVVPLFGSGSSWVVVNRVEPRRLDLECINALGFSGSNRLTLSVSIRVKGKGFEKEGKGNPSQGGRIVRRKGQFPPSLSQLEALQISPNGEGLKSGGSMWKRSCD
ncbi:hypothetical protein RIF29_30014 [Crotalaria pallida]|uniref:Uncharacterized protein n=1 Tax=Crotalaria pallida TaxID=3830 RepID=A0AAN9EKQ9_CROPI